MCVNLSFFSNLYCWTTLLCIFCKYLPLLWWYVFSLVPPLLSLAIETKWNELALAPEGVYKFYDASFMWWYWDSMSVQMTKPGLEAGLITLGFTSIVVILSSRSLVLTLVSAVTNVFILVVSSATLVRLVGWELGFIESVCLSILIGISCDFVINFGHAYKHLEGHVDSRLRARFAVVIMGPIILAAAGITVAAALVMIFCSSTPFFTKFTTILLGTMFYATIGSLNFTLF